MYTIEKKKRANSRNYSPVAEFGSEAGVLMYMKENDLKYVGTPYVFTHIQLTDGYIIRQTCMGFICSPDKLNKLLTK